MANDDSKDLEVTEGNEVEAARIMQAQRLIDGYHAGRLAEAMEEMRELQQKYGSLPELSPVWEEMERFRRSIVKEGDEEAGRRIG